jgi:hypothetical protein
MSDISREKDDEGTIAALLDRANRRIPNLLAIKKRLEGGDTLSQIEIEELGNMIEASDHNRELIDRHPEYQELAARAASLIEDITRLAVANEENAGKR